MSSSDLTVGIDDLGLSATLQLQLGQTLTLSGGGPCGEATYPSAASERPVLEETGHHVLQGVSLPGYTDITYRAVEPGQVTVKPSGAGLRPDQTITVVVLPDETPAQAALRGAGTITVTGAATGPVGTFALGGVSCRRVIDMYGEQPAPGTMTFRSGGLTYQVGVNSSRYGPPDTVQVGRPVGAGMDWYMIARAPDPRSRPATLVDGGWVSGPITPLDHGRGGGSIALRWWC